MASLNEQVLEAFRHAGDSLLFETFVARIEAVHSADAPGVERETVVAYADALERDGPTPFSAAEVEKLIETRLTSSSEWEDDALFDLGPGRVSLYPPAWHEALRNTTDPREYVRVIGEAVATARGKSDRSVPRPMLRQALTVIGGMTHKNADAAIMRQQRSGELIVYPDQNPEADVRLPDHSDGLTEGS